MSAHHNPVMHPDENLLAAFAEDALTGAERETVLSHLSGCARCRDVVFVARESAAQQEAIQEVAVRPMRRRWMRWQTATAAAWVFALVVGAALLWHRRENVLPKNQQAIVRPAEPPVVNGAGNRRQEQSAAPAPAMPAAQARQPRNGPANAENKALENRKKIAASREKELVPAESETVTVAQSYIAPPTGAPEQQAAIANSQLRSMPMAGTQAVTQPANRAMLQKAPPPPAPAPPTGPVTASNQLAAAQPSVASAQGEISAVSVSSAGELSVSPRLPQFSIRKGKLERLDASGYKAVALPAGMQARSVAAYANVVLLLTKQRRLYRSVDSGQHWLPVPNQWNGKPVELRLRMDAALSPLPRASDKRREYTSDSLAAKDQVGDQAGDQAGAAGGMGSAEMNGAPQAAQAAAKPASPPMAGAVFELTNGAGKRWLSRDGGQSWQPE